MHVKTNLLWWIFGFGVFLLGLGIALVPVLQIGYLEVAGEYENAEMPQVNTNNNVSIQIADNWGVVGSSSGELAILDINDPQNLQVSTNLIVSHDIQKIYLFDTKAILITLHDGLFLYDSTDLNNPILLSNYSSDYVNYEGLFSENYFVLHQGLGRFLFFDVLSTDWSSPSFIQDYNQEYSDIKIAENLIYAISYSTEPSHSLEILTIDCLDNCSNTTYNLAWYDLQGEEDRKLQNIAIFEDILYILSDQPYIYCVELPLNEQTDFRFIKTSKIESRSPFSLQQFEEIFFDEFEYSGDTWFHTEVNGGLVMVDISNPLNPKTLEIYLPKNQQIESFDFNEDNVYVLLNNGEIISLNRIYNPSIYLPVLIGLIIGLLIVGITLSFSGYFLFIRWRAKFVEFQAVLEKNRISIQIQDYLKKDLTELRLFTLQVYPKHKKLQLSDFGIKLFKDFYNRLIDPETRVLEYTTARARFVKYYEKSTIQIAQGVVHDHPLADWELKRLYHEADNEVITYLEQHLAPTNSVLIELRKKFSMTVGKNDQLLL